MRGRAGIWALLVIVTLFSVTARAEVDIKRAKEHFAKAEQLYRVERFQDAFTEYQEAFLAKPDPNLLYNMAQCQRLMGNRPEAVRLYRRFLAERPNPPNLAAVQMHLRMLEGGGPTPAVATAPPPLVAPLPGLAAPAPRAPIIEDRPLASAAAPSSSRLTMPPPIAAPPLPPQSLAMSHQPGATNLVRTDVGPGSRNNDDEQPVYKKWWFWTAVGAVLAGAVVVGVVAGHKSDPSCDGLVACH